MTNFEEAQQRCSKLNDDLSPDCQFRYIVSINLRMSRYPARKEKDDEKFSV